MPDEELKNKSDDNELSEEERIKREIAEYEALLEDELKPITLSFEEPEQEIKEQEEQEKPIPSEAIELREEAQELKSLESTGLQKEEKSKSGEEPPAGAQVEDEMSVSAESSPAVSHPETLTEPQKNKVDVLEQLAEAYERSIEGVSTTPESLPESAQVIDEETKVFQRLLEEYVPRVRSVNIGEVLEVPIVLVRPDYVLVDLGGKAEAVVDINELVDEKGDINVRQGDKIKVMVTGWDEENGQVLVSHRSAKIKESIEHILNCFAEQLPVKGTVQEVLKSGVLVDVEGVNCFLPASQMDVSRVDDLSSFLGKEISALVIDADQTGRRIVLSRRRLLEQEIQKQRELLLNSLEPGSIVSGKVKAVMDFGVFIDLGGIDGFVPRDEVSWDKGAQPSEYFKEGRMSKVKVIAVDKDSGKVSLSRKQMKDDPWEKVEETYPPGKVVRGVVVAILEYGAFVRVTEGLTGLIHISDMSWTERVTNPRDYLSEGQRVRCVVLGVDKERQRLSLGLKQLSPDPWEDAKTNYPIGTKIKGKVRSVSDNGVLVELEEDVRGFVEPADLSWSRRPPKPQSLFKRNDDIEAIVIGFDDTKRKLKLGVKQLTENPFDRYVRLHPEGSNVRGKVSRLTSFGAFVTLEPGVEGLLHISQIDTKRIQEPKEVLHVGQPLYMKITNIDYENKKIALSRRDYLLEQEKREVQQFLKIKDSGGIKLGELLKNININPSSEK
ncbi:S1 RNA-binding domain-containing protein [Candidatus Sumerlaeota bacterium]|nr:S1 RNA-binding domain-containing protein [Candidatus Sumerlaeota bacterium]